MKVANKLPLLVLLPLLALGGLALTRLRRPKQNEVIVADQGRAEMAAQPIPVAVPVQVPAPVIAAPLITKRRLPLLRIKKVKKVVPAEEVVEVAQVQPVARPAKHYVKTLYPALGEEYEPVEEVPVRRYGRML
jgi:hypothetical protein